MPLWHLYCPENVYSAEDKRALAARITDLYAQVGLPRFYVSVAFHDLPQDSFFIGGNPTNNFIRIWIDQVARHTPAERRQWWLERITRHSIRSCVTEAIAGRSTLTRRRLTFGPLKG
jgi:phenylpyruvate tautomerase PptA (4-oxalocrotonate tautomerase family)